jgi:hypothetical protein
MLYVEHSPDVQEQLKKRTFERQLFHVEHRSLRQLEINIGIANSKNVPRGARRFGNQ